MLVLAGYPGYDLAKVIAEKLGATYINVTERTFPDGELYIRLVDYEKVHLQNTIVVSTLYPEQERRLWKTLLIIDAVKNNNPRKLIAVIPYLAYSRQDRIFLPGEPVSACMLVKILRTMGIDMLLTIDVHSPRVIECFGPGGVNVQVSDLLVSHALKYVENPVVIAPDKGAFDRASYAARAVGLEYDYLVKQRDKVTGEVSYMPREVSVKNRDVIIVDDIISTGGTIAEASKMLIKQGARRIVVAATHGLLAGDAISKLERAGLCRLVLADTIAVKHEHSLIDYVDVSDRIVDGINSLLR